MLDPFLAPRSLAGTHKLPQELITRLVESMRLTTHSPSGRTTLQLELKGTAFEGMTVRLQRHQGTVSGLFLVDRLATKEAVEAQLVSLRERLEAQGIHVGELRVEFRSQVAADAGASGDRPGSNRENASDEPGSDRGGTSDSKGGAPGAAGDTRPPIDRESGTDYSV